MALSELFGHRFQDSLLDGNGQSRIELSRRNRVRGGLMTGKELIGYEAQGILVGQLAPVDGVLELFWRQVRVCAALLIRLSLNCSQPEIGEHRFTAGNVEGVIRVELASNNGR